LQEAQVDNVLRPCTKFVTKKELLEDNEILLDIIEDICAELGGSKMFSRDLQDRIDEFLDLEDSDCEEEIIDIRPEQ